MQIRKICLGILGLTSSILGIVCYSMDVGSYEMSVTYGGDAYTGIQNAAAQTANNLLNLGDIVKFGFGSVLLIAGLVMLVFAVTNKNSSTQSIMPKAEKPTTTEPTPFQNFLNPVPPYPQTPVQAAPVQQSPVSAAPALAEQPAPAENPEV